MNKPASLGRIILYVRDVERSAEFYARHFGYELHREAGDRIAELLGPDGAASIMLHPAAKSQKLGQVSVKLVFDVVDVERFVVAAGKAGLKFGALHRGDGYVFANAKDPDGNAISVSSRAYRKISKAP
jgi:catechol 2,3-dioxygenase-like lactoylglutathione lyase family enzyme